MIFRGWQSGTRSSMQKPSAHDGQIRCTNPQWGRRDEIPSHDPKASGFVRTLFELSKRFLRPVLERRACPEQVHSTDPARSPPRQDLQSVPHTCSETATLVRHMPDRATTRDVASFARAATVEDVRERASGGHLGAVCSATVRFKSMVRSKMPESITVDTTAYPGSLI